VVNDITLPWAIICDIDGTLAHMNGRTPHEYDRVDEDQTHTAIINLLKTWKRATNDQIILLSGRKNHCQAKTQQWLNEHEIPHDELHLPRANDDHRKDFILKEEWYDSYITERYNIRLVIDDRLQVCQMWYKKGLPIVRVGNPNSDF
jgi:hypothetical protein